MHTRSLSLRLKLTLWYLLVFGAIQVTLLFGFVLLRQDAIRRSFDDQLLSTAEGLASAIQSRGLPQGCGQLGPLAPRDTKLVLGAVRDNSYRVITSFGLPEDRAPRFQPYARPESGLPGPMFDTVTRDQARHLAGLTSELRLVTLPFKLPDRDMLFLQAARPARTWDGSLGEYSDLLFVGLPVGLIAASIAAWLIAGRAVGPIVRMSHAARGVSPNNPGARFPPAGDDREIARLHQELNSALERMEAGLESQQQFISNVSHELKTPISVLLTESQVLKRHGAESDDYVRYVGSVEEEMRRLGALVDSFLTLARVEVDRSHFEPEPVCAYDVLLDAVQHNHAFARLHGVRLVPRVEQVDPAPELEGDARLLGALLDNLIRNAVRHSPRGGTVEVECAAAESEVLFRVRDEGPGLPEGMRERVFERFARGPQEPDRPRTTGLGLAIAREIAHLHRGRIAIEDRAGEGCTFAVSLPLMQRVESAARNGK